MSFQWLNDLIQGLLKFVPIPVIVRATEGGVKWVRGHKVKKMKPGWHMIWPLTTKYEIVVTARQTVNLPHQALVTKDGKQIVVGGFVVCAVSDVVLAIGEKNWDCLQTVNDIAQAAIVSVITKWNYSDLLNKLTTLVEEQLTRECKHKLKDFGVHVFRCSITDFSTARTIKLMTTEPPAVS